MQARSESPNNQFHKQAVSNTNLTRNQAIQSLINIFHTKFGEKSASLTYFWVKAWVKTT